MLKLTVDSMQRSYHYVRKCLAQARPTTPYITKCSGREIVLGAADVQSQEQWKDIKIQGALDPHEHGAPDLARILSCTCQAPRSCLCRLGPSTLVPQPGGTRAESGCIVRAARSAST